MTVEELRKKVEGTVFPIAPINYDCSEYTEDAMRELGLGFLITFTAKPEWFSTMEKHGLSSPYNYHTVLAVGCSDCEPFAIVDLTNPQRVQTFNQFKSQLEEINNGATFDWYKGCP